MTDRGGTSRLALRGRTVDVSPADPLVMAVVNASPDSFSDGGELATLDAQVARALELAAAGADIVDVGGESGVTDTPATPPEIEAARVVPLVRALAERSVTVSVDTWKADVARAALDAGASMINDVSGLLDLELARLCAATGAALVVMHTRARPKHKDFPVYKDVRADVRAFLEELVRAAVDAGLAPEQIVVDPGPDFGKTPAETVEVLRHLDELQSLGRPMLLAVSRKDFIGAVTSTAPPDRGPGTLAAIGEGLDRGASILRVHDVAATVQYLAVRRVLRGDEAVPADLRVPEHLRRRRR